MRRVTCGIARKGDITNPTSAAVQRPSHVWFSPCANVQSDIWALGCILYEMASLKRTFDGSNLPALVNKIMKGSFAPITGP